MKIVVVMQGTSNLLSNMFVRGDKNVVTKKWKLHITKKNSEMHKEQNEK